MMLFLFCKMILFLLVTFQCLKYGSSTEAVVLGVHDDDITSDSVPNLNDLNFLGYTPFYSNNTVSRWFDMKDQDDLETLNDQENIKAMSPVYATKEVYKLLSSYGVTIPSKEISPRATLSSKPIKLFCCSYVPLCFGFLGTVWNTFWGGVNMIWDGVKKIWTTPEKCCQPHADCCSGCCSSNGNNINSVNIDINNQVHKLKRNSFTAKLKVDRQTLQGTGTSTGTYANVTIGVVATEDALTDGSPIAMIPLLYSLDGSDSSDNPSHSVSDEPYTEEKFHDGLTRPRPPRVGQKICMFSAKTNYFCQTIGNE